MSDADESVIEDDILRMIGIAHPPFPERQSISPTFANLKAARSSKIISKT